MSATHALDSTPSRRPRSISPSSSAAPPEISALARAWEVSHACDPAPRATRSSCPWKSSAPKGASARPTTPPWSHATRPAAMVPGCIAGSSIKVSTITWSMPHRPKPEATSSPREDRAVGATEDNAGGTFACDRWLDGRAPLAGWPVVAKTKTGMGDPVTI
jgi:hypothetical protein